MKDLKGTKTERNLQEAFAGESQARNKYSYYASKAKKDGYEQIAALFEETAHNEKEHAKLWFKLLHGGEIADTMTTSAMPPRAKTTSGPTCMTAWQKKPKKRDSPKSPSNSAPLVPSSATTRSAICACSRTSRRESYSRARATPSGYAATAVTSS